MEIATTSFISLVTKIDWLAVAALRHGGIEKKTHPPPKKKKISEIKTNLHFPLRVVKTDDYLRILPPPKNDFAHLTF